MEASREVIIEQLVTAAEQFLPTLRERSLEIDRLRHLPQDLSEAMAGEGFYRICAPEPLGGLDAGPLGLCKVCEKLAEANGSAAWCIFIGATSQYLFGALPESQRAKMLENPNVITSGVFADSGTARFEQRDGQPGYVINGHWRWGSGCHNAAWISGGIHEVDAQGEKVRREESITRAFFQPHEIDILDNWHVSGLRGSGSSDYLAEDVWLPAERMATLIEYTEFANLPIYHFPRFGLLSLPIGAIALGMARASVEEVRQVAQEKTPQGSRRTLAMRAGLHRDIAAYDTELRAAHALFYAEIERAWEHAQTALCPLEQRLALRTANIHAVTASIKVIDKMYSVVGGTSVFESSCLQQHFRDVHVASQHMMVGEGVMELAGRVMLGLDQEAPGL
ncbi:MAG: acyl-CoA dehydrogenase family protein [Pseudomonadota bacterium]